MANVHFPKYVPDEGPVDGSILFVGEAPGETEDREARPFVGESGRILMDVLGRAGVSREEVRLGNIVHYRPYGNKFELLLHDDSLKSGLKELYSHIEKYKPTVICALGSWPLTFLTGRKGIKKWRGSIIPYIHDSTIKVIPTVHPAAVLRDRGLYPIFDCDVKRVVGDSHFRDFKIPVRRFIIDPRGLECEEWVQRLSASEFLGTDIETVKNSNRILCCGFSPSPDLAVCFVPGSPEGRRAIERVLLSPAKKIFQLGTYDTLQLLHENGYELDDPRAMELDRPYFWDTLVAQHTLAPELPRSLEYLTSVYTREPYYKTVGRGTIPDDEKGWSEKVEKQSLFEYNCRDCCVTIEIALQQMDEMAEESEGIQNIMQFDMEMVGASRDISAAGLPIDNDRRALIERVLLKKWGTKQFVLDRLTGFETNVKSPKLKTILYEKMGLPTRRNRKGGITTDEDAIVSLITHCKDHLNGLSRPDAVLDWTVKLAVCQTVLEIRGIRQVLSNYILEKQKNGRPRASIADGRIRSMYRIGPETGRWSASKYVDGTGFNAQTLPRDPVEIPLSEYESALTSAVPVGILSQLADDDDDEEGEEDGYEAE